MQVFIEQVMLVNLRDNELETIQKMNRVFRTFIQIYP